MAESVDVETHTGSDRARDDAVRAAARIEEIDTLTLPQNLALSVVVAIPAFFFLDQFGWELAVIGLVPLLSWITGLATLRARLGISVWTRFHLTVIALALVGAALLTGGAESPILPLAGIHGVPLVVYFPRSRLAMATATLIVLAVVIIDFGTGQTLASPLDPVVALIIAFAAPLTVKQLMEIELLHRSRAIIDPLTGCLNRHAFNTRTDELEAQMGVTKEPIGVVMFDVDHFKLINDDHGHAVGDAVLAQLAYAVRKSLRTYELLYRMGGEEFVVLLPGADLLNTARIAERVRAVLEELVVVGGHRISVSCGAASDQTDDIDSIVARADQAMYRAKDDGRNRTCCALRDGSIVAADQLGDLPPSRLAIGT